MKVREIDTIKNKDFIVLLPESDYMIKDSVEYTFKNFFYLNYEKTEEDTEKLIKEAKLQIALLKEEIKEKEEELNTLLEELDEVDNYE